MKHFRQGRSCVDNRLNIMPLLLLVCHTTYLSHYELTLGRKMGRLTKIKILRIRIAD
jgi:hypothetical protein